MEGTEAEVCVRKIISSRQFLVAIIKFDVFCCLIFRKYPAYLSVTVGPYQPETTTGSISLTRPMSVLEEETTGDIYTYASDADEPIDDQTHQVASGASGEKQLQPNRSNSVNRIEAKILKIKPRLPGQVWCCFNQLLMPLFIVVFFFHLSDANVPIESCTNTM